MGIFFWKCRSLSGKKKRFRMKFLAHERQSETARDSESERATERERERERERPETMSYPSAEDVAASLPHFDDAVKYING